jgi:predicted amidophosphoribosyltransferase
VDDIVTTGATAAECARTLRVAGARAVGVLAVARVLAVTL